MAQLRVLSDLEKRVSQQVGVQTLRCAALEPCCAQIQLDTEELERLSKAEATRRRAPLNKLVKDFDQVKQQHQALCNEMANVARRTLDSEVGERKSEEDTRFQIQLQGEVRA
jgi:hypothetical protein